MDRAIEIYRTAIEIDPENVSAHSNLGTALYGTHQFPGALESYRRALELKPDFAEAYSNLSVIYADQGKIDEAIEALKKAVELKPSFSVAHSNLICQMELANNAVEEVQNERRKWAARHANPISHTHKRAVTDRNPDRRIRVGYVSADFRRHSAMSVFTSLLCGYDREKFAVYAYSNNHYVDEVTQRFQKSVDDWRDVADMNDDSLDTLIRADKIDILVDLAGHTAGNRLLAFARKPAPIMLNWGAGTGMDAMDGVLADPVLLPKDERKYYAEKVHYIPQLFSVTNEDPYPDVGPLPALKNGHITFGAFNRISKVSRRVVQVWAHIMKSVPGSRFLLKTTELSDPATEKKYLDYFAEEGIGEDRVDTQGRTSWVEHVAQYNDCDIHLDTFPQTGGVTTLESLMMGCPVLTLAWPSMPGRATASMLTEIGLTDWIEDTEAGYIHSAVKKAKDIESLSDVRNGLRDRVNGSVLGNPDQFTKSVEKVYLELFNK